MVWLQWSVRGREGTCKDEADSERQGTRTAESCDRQKQGCQLGSSSGPLPAGQIVLLISQDDSKRKRRLGEAKSFVHGPELHSGWVGIRMLAGWIHRQGACIAVLVALAKPFRLCKLEVPWQRGWQCRSGTCQGLKCIAWQIGLAKSPHISGPSLASTSQHAPDITPQCLRRIFFYYNK